MPGPNHIATWLIAITAAYLVGAIPVGFLIGRMKGVDIRQHGSRNVGATNVSRVLGRRLGLLCFVLDALKGSLPVLGAGLAAGTLGRAPSEVAAGDMWLWLAVAAAAIVGHMFSIFLRFRGGKGVATGFGAMLGMWPWLTAPAAVVFVIWILVAAAWRYVSLASMIAAALLPIVTFAWLLVIERGSPALGWQAAIGHGWPLVATTTVLAGVIIWRHRANIGRLLRSEEPRIGARS